MEEEEDDVSDDEFDGCEDADEDLTNLQYEPNPYHEDLWGEQ